MFLSDNENEVEEAYNHPFLPTVILSTEETPNTSLIIWEFIDNISVLKPQFFENQFPPQ